MIDNSHGQRICKLSSGFVYVLHDKEHQVTMELHTFSSMKQTAQGFGFNSVAFQITKKTKLGGKPLIVQGFKNSKWTEWWKYNICAG